jgi:Tfp pilus assembly protein PilN
VRAVNLIPEDQRAGGAGVAGRSNGAAYVVLALVGGLALLALLYGLAHRQVTSRKAQAASLNARAQQAQTAAAGLAPYTNFVSLREEREHAVSQLVDSRFDWAHAFHEIARVLPRTASITSIQGTIGSTSGTGSGSGTSSSSSGTSSSSATTSSSSATSPASTSKGAASSAVSATPPGSVPTFTVSGCATSQAQVARVLNRLRLVDGVQEVTLQSSSKPTVAGATGSVGQCPPNGPAFTVVLTFAPLPTQSAIQAVAVVPATNTGGSR